VSDSRKCLLSVLPCALLSVGAGDVLSIACCEPAELSALLAMHTTPISWRYLSDNEPKAALAPQHLHEPTACVRGILGEAKPLPHSPLALVDVGDGYYLRDGIGSDVRVAPNH